MLSRRAHKGGGIYRAVAPPPRWILKVTNPHSEYVIRIAFPLLQWSQERVSLLGSTYTACLVITQFFKSNINYVLLHGLVPSLPQGKNTGELLFYPTCLPQG